MAARAKLPTGTVTFLSSDIEGSTRLLNALGRERYGEILRRHNLHQAALEISSRAQLPTALSS